MGTVSTGRLAACALLPIKEGKWAGFAMGALMRGAAAANVGGIGTVADMGFKTGASMGSGWGASGLSAEAAASSAGAAESSVDSIP